MKTSIEILADLIEEIDDQAYQIAPVESDYFYQGVAEQMVLDAKREIADELYQIVDKYRNLYSELDQ